MAVRVGLLAGLVFLSIDPGRLASDAATRNVPSTWVQAVADRRPCDLIVSFAPTLTSHYLGRTDFWLRSEGYAKYAWRDRLPLRDVHSGAVIIRDTQELESLLQAKVFLELWVKVRSGWADDEAHLRSYGYE